MNKSKMFVFFWLPYDVKYSSENFRTAFSLAVSRFPEGNSIHIGQKALFSLASKDFSRNFHNTYHHDVPDESKLGRLNKYLINPEIFEPLENTFSSNNLVWKSLMTEAYQPLVAEIDSILDNISKQYDIAGVLTWCNTPSLTVAAEKRGLPVIHNEMGPLRGPYYEHTAYFDFMGVNGNTEVLSRLNNLKQTSDYQYIVDRQLSTETILLLLAQKAALDDINRHVRVEYDFGVPLQVEDDSNIIAYSNGFNNFEIIRYIQDLSAKVIFRKHPLGHIDYREANKDVIATSPIIFIKQCDCIATINSSMAYEAVLFNKKTMILGDSPFNILADMGKSTSVSNSEGELITNINFITFCYLMPFEFLYDFNYYIWRLSAPDEKEIFNFHLNYYLSHKGILLDNIESVNDYTLSGLLVNGGNFICPPKELTIRDKIENIKSLGLYSGLKYITKRAKVYLSGKQQ